MSGHVALKTLVLDQNYMPVSIFPLQTIPAQDAITRVINETCHVVFEYDRIIKTQHMNMKWPSVIARNASDRIGNNVKLDREFLYYRDHAVCMYCSKKLTLGSTNQGGMTIDHVIPRVAGGGNTWDNVVSSCYDCNQEKADSMPTGRWKPMIAPKKPTYWELVKIRRKFPLTIYDESWMNFIGDWQAPVKIVGAAI